jgi:hypothetical protein
MTEYLSISDNAKGSKRAWGLLGGNMVTHFDKHRIKFHVVRRFHDGIHILHRIGALR